MLDFTPTPVPTGPLTIDYAYDPLYRLTSANYSTGDFYHYAYDSVGNRLTESNQLSVNSYQYDAANRLADVNGVAYAWDANGNLLNDGVNSYVYDSANRLTSVNGTTSYTYNGLGDRLSQNGTQYVLDLNAGLTQVLSDGTNSYTYGLGRISQTGSSTEYFLGDALGSVRQLVNDNAKVTLAKSYDPYGNRLQSAGMGQSAYGYTGETTDANGLIYLRARYYSPVQGRFFQQDPWSGDSSIPATLNPYLYGLNNPILYTDPSGENPLAPVLALAGVIALGGVTSGIYGCFSYEWALTGQCGCKLQQDAQSMSKADWVTAHILFGGFASGVASFAIAGAAISPAAAVIVGGVALGYAIWDGIDLLNVVYQEGVGWTPCNISRAAMDLAVAIFGATNLVSGLRAFRASGSYLGWGGGGASSESEVMLSLKNRPGQPTYDRIPTELFLKGRNAYWYTDWKKLGLSDFDATLSIPEFEKAFPQAMNRGYRINFDITGLDINKAWTVGQTTGKGVTYFEFYQIMTHPEWLGKTTFYKWEGGLIKWFTITQQGEIIPKYNP